MTNRNHSAGTDISEVDDRLKPHGLVVLAVAPETGGDSRASRVLAGNAGPGMWPVFSRSPEFGDGLPDPLDRWSRRVGQQVAEQLGAQVLFPFGGPPYTPVLRWAEDSGVAFRSPLSMFIHRDHGLWHAYRFVLVLELGGERNGPAVPHRSPCLDCRDQPCLSACPVDAFRDGRYLVDVCTGYLSANPDCSCMSRGCRARRHCPVAPESQYSSDQASFHMAAFMRARNTP